MLPSNVVRYSTVGYILCFQKFEELYKSFEKKWTESAITVIYFQGVNNLMNEGLKTFLLNACEKMFTCLYVLANA